MTKRQIFYSFHYDNDNWRAAQIRNIGAIDGNKPAPDNDWETIKKGGEQAIQKWIDNQMYYRSATILLVGSETANRKWINYEIKRSWANKMGLVGICIHNLKDRNSNQSKQGANPFDFLNLNGTPLSKIIKVYNPPYSISTNVYSHISENISDWVEESIKIRNRY